MPLLRSSTMTLPFVDLKAQYRRLAPLVGERIERVLEHGQFILGPEVGELEQALADYVGARHALGVSSGTDALLVALMAEGIGPGDAVFVPSFTFTATAEVVLLLGATPVFADVDERTYNLDPSSLDAQLARVRVEGELRPRALIAVDLFGLPADYAALAPLAEREGLLLIDDAAQGLGAELAEGKVGALAPVTATSFFPAKPLGAYGDAGAIFTDDSERVARMRSIHVHGEGANRYDIVRLGLNARLDTLQAAVLLAKLTVFDDELERRAGLAAFYDERLADVVLVPQRPRGVRCAWAQYTIQLEAGERDRVRAALAAEGIPTAIYYPRPMHLQPAYAAHGEGEGSLPVSERLAGRVLSLPMHPYLAEADAERICTTLRRALGRS